MNIFISLPWNLFNIVHPRTFGVCRWIDKLAFDSGVLPDFARDKVTILPKEFIDASRRYIFLRLTECDDRQTEKHTDKQTEEAVYSCKFCSERRKTRKKGETRMELKNLNEPLKVFKCRVCQIFVIPEPRIWTAHKFLCLYILWDLPHIERLLPNYGSRQYSNPCNKETDVSCLTINRAEFINY